MDLMTISNTLKNLSDQQLQAVPHTSPEVPPFVYLAEMQRRQEMRKEFQSEQAKQAQPGQGKTVVQELMQNLSRPQAPPQGAPQGPPQGGPPQPPGPRPMGGPPPQGIAALGRPPGMAGGGYVGYAGGGEMDQGDTGPDTPDEEMPAPAASAPVAAPSIKMLPVTPDEIAKMYPGMTIEQAYKIAQGMRGHDYMGPIAAELAAQSAKAQAAKPNMWQALAQAGFNMAAEPTKNFGRAVAVGGLAGLGNLQEQKERQQAMAMKLMENRINVAKTQEGGEDRNAQLADAIFRNQNARMNTIIETGQANQRKNEGNILARYAQTEKEADPSISDAEAYKRANLKYQQDQAKAAIATTRAKAAIDAKNATPESQMFNGVVKQMGKKYGVQSDDVSFGDLPLDAQKETMGLIRHSNPSLTDLAIAKAGGNLPKAFDLLESYHKKAAAAAVDPMNNFSLGGGQLQR